MSALDDAPEVHADDRATWRIWLDANHATAKGAWLVTWRARSGHPSLEYEAAVEEALCFGWVDSTGGRVDDDRTKVYFAPRKLRSPWAATNKARVERLIRDGLIAPAGLATIERAKSNGSWEVLDSVERLEIPPDLAAALENSPPAAANFDAFPPSARKMQLTWVALAQDRNARHADRHRGGRGPQRTCPNMTRPAPIDIKIHPLTPDRFDDLATLFAQGGDPAGAGVPTFESGFLLSTRPQPVIARCGGRRRRRRRSGRAPASSPTTGTTRSVGSASGRAPTTTG